MLVVDDEPDTVLTLVTLLRDEGYEAEGFGSAAAAMKALQAFDSDVVIADISMPQMNGWDLARHIRELMGKDRPLLIAISGRYHKSSDKILADIVGYHYYLSKPCDPKVVIELASKAKPE